MTHVVHEVLLLFLFLGLHHVVDHGLLGEGEHLVVDLTFLEKSTD
jgi:hypothetical protein